MVLDKIIIQDNHHSYGQNNEIYKKVIKYVIDIEQWLKFSEKHMTLNLKITKI